MSFGTKETRSIMVPLKSKDGFDFKVELSQVDGCFYNPEREIEYQKERLQPIADRMTIVEFILNRRLIQGQLAYLITYIECPAELEKAMASK